MKAALILLALAYVHIGRGSPIANHEMDKPAKAPEPAAAGSGDQAPSAAEKPDICKVTINGKEETLGLGDRYCKDETTNGVCGYGGETAEFPCDSGFKCHKHAKEWKVTCLQLNTNQGIKYGEDGNAPAPVITIDGVKQDGGHDNAKAAPQSDSAPSKPAPAAGGSDVVKGSFGGTEQGPPKPHGDHADYHGTTHVDPQRPPPPPPKHEEPAPPPAPKHEEPTAPKHVEPVPPKPEPQGTPKPETCKATIDGQEQTLQPGDRYCLTETTNRVCNWGEFVDYECPSQSKCLKSPDKWQVLCRIVNKNKVDPSAPVPRRR